MFSIGDSDQSGCRCEKNNNKKGDSDIMRQRALTKSKRSFSGRTRECKREEENGSNSSKEIRKEEVMAIRNRFPNKIPVIVQKYWKDNQLPQLDKSKFLVPQDITMSQFQTIIRNRMRMNQNQALYLLVNEKSMLSLSLTLGEVYTEHAGPNGFLYVTYASQEVFGTS